MADSQQLGDVLFSYDSQRKPIKSSEREPGKTPYLGASGVVDFVQGCTHSGQYLCISEDGANLLTRSLPIAWVQEGEFWANNHLHVLGGVSRDRLKFFQYAVENSNIASYVTRSAQPKLSQRSVMAIQVPSFGVIAEEAIGAFLGALDDKIAANSRSVVSAKKLAISIAEKCEAIVPVAEIATRVATSLNPKKIELQEVMHYSIPAFDQGYVSVELSDSIKSSKFKLDRPCVLVSKLNPQTPRVWSVPIIEKDVYSLASTEFIVLEPVGCNLGQLFAAVYQDSLFVELQSQASGTSNSHQRVKPDDLLSALVPDVRRLSTDEVSLLDGLNLLAYKLKRENQALAKTRDELLPLLMSGKITVREAEEAAAEVGVETRGEEGNV